MYNLDLICHFFHLSSTHLFILTAMPIVHSNPHYPSIFHASSHEILILYYHTSAGEPRMIHSCFTFMLLFQAFKVFHNLTLSIPPNQDFALIDRSSHFSLPICLFLNLCFSAFYEFIVAQSISHISLNLQILPYLPKIRMLQTPSKQLFPCSHRFLLLILFSFVLSGRRKGLLTATSIYSFHCQGQIRYTKRRPLYF